MKVKLQLKNEQRIFLTPSLYTNHKERNDDINDVFVICMSEARSEADRKQPNQPDDIH